MNSDRQMVVLEALRVLEKRVERNLSNAELTIMWLTEKEKDESEFKALAEWKEEVESDGRRLRDIKEVRKEVLRETQERLNAFDEEPMPF